MKAFFTTLSVVFLLTTTAFNQENIDYSNKYIGYNQRVSAGILGGDKSSLSIQINNGVSLGKHMELTTGLGYERFYNRNYIPMLLDFNYLIFKGPVTPLLKINGGYMMDLDRNRVNIKENYGLTSGASIGVRSRKFEHFQLSTYIGYRFIFLSKKEANYCYWCFGPPTQPVTEMHLNRVELRMEITFNE